MQEKKTHKTSVGGQALIEGIMMQGPKGMATAVRKPDGDILTEYHEFHRLREKYKFLGWPLVRGAVNFFESMVIGYKTLMYSAEVSGMFNVLNKHFDGTLTPAQGTIEGVTKIIIFVVYIALVSRMKDIRRTFMYHGAEHKSIACYESGLDLTVENVKKMTRFHPRCGTSFIFVMLIFSVIFYSILAKCFPVIATQRVLWMLLKLVFLPILMGLGYEFIRYAGKHDNLFVKIVSAPGLWMQRLTTREPDDSMMEVGIAALKAVITDNPEDDEIK